jgi:hypothetical protein
LFRDIFAQLNTNKNDRGISVLTSQFLKHVPDSKALLDFSKELFETTLNPLKDESVYILDLTERIQASLNLFYFLVIRERSLLSKGELAEPILTEKEYLDKTIRTGYFESLARTIQAGLMSVDEEVAKIDTSSTDPM